MLAHLHLSDSALARIVKLRLLAEFRPVDEPITYRRTPCWMDGLDLRTVDIVPSSRPMPFTLGTVLPDGTVGAAPGAPTSTVTPVTVKVGGAVLLAPTVAVSAAGKVGPDNRYGLPDRPELLQVPILGAEIDVYLTVEPTGVPRLHLPVRSLPGADCSGAYRRFSARWRS